MTSISHLRFVFFLFFFCLSTVWLLPAGIYSTEIKAYSARRQIGQEKKDTPLHYHQHPIRPHLYRIFSHWMTVPYDYHHRLLLRAGSQHSAKTIPPYHTIPHHTIPHSKTAFSLFLVHIRDRQATERAFFASIPKPVLSFGRQPFFVCRSGAHSMPTFNQSINASINQIAPFFFFFFCNYIFVEKRVGAGSREHIRLWITLASTDGWMDGWLGLGWDGLFLFFFFFLAAPVRVGGGRL